MRAHHVLFGLSVLHGAALCGLLTFAAPFPAAAAGIEDAFKACTAENTILAEREKQCTAAIESGAYKHDKLALALTYRGSARGRLKNFAGALTDLDEAIRQ